MMNYSADIDLYEVWAASFHENYPFLDAKAKYSSGFAGRRVNEHFRHSNEEILAQFSDCMVMAEPVPGAYADAMGEFFFLVKHKSVERVREILKYILELADD